MGVTVGFRRFKSKSFARFARREGIPDSDLAEAVERLQRGLVGADLGGGLYKQRLARPGGGRSGGYRTILCFRREERVFFVHGFSKSSQGNITKIQERDLKVLASVLLQLPSETLRAMLDDGSLIEF